jgi:flagellar basal body rod protein FlgC
MVTGSMRLRPSNDYIANCRLVLSSERAPYVRKKVIVKQRKLKSGHGPDKQAV